MGESAEQKEERAALKYGEIVDISFPAVDPQGDEKEGTFWRTNLIRKEFWSCTM